jgi:Carboxypeptidase regulatory-like domain/FlgD Ig-like domain
MVRRFFTSFMLLMAAIVTPKLAEGQIPISAPFFLNAQATTTGNVHLQWMSPKNVSVQYYAVFRSTVLDSSSFTQIDSTSDTDYVDTPPSSAFVYYFVAAHVQQPSAMTLVSNVATVRLFPGPMHDRVVIISKPVDRALVGTPYEYQVVAQSSDSASISFSLLQHPANMTISASGLIQWTPVLRGWYGVEVKALSVNGGIALQAYIIRVGAGNGTIAGTVTDSLGHGLGAVMIQVYERNQAMHFDYSAITDSSGKYSIPHLDDGSYLVRAIPLRPEYLPEWYNGVMEEKNATPVTVNDSSTTTVNFTLEARASALPQFTVEGSVTDTTNAVIKNANVFFVRAGFCTNSMIPSNGDWSNDEDYRDLFENWNSAVLGDFRIDGHSQFVIKVAVDSTGSFSVHLAEGSYIAFAEAPGYERQFFSRQTDFLSANIINLTSDTTAINFALVGIPPVPLGEISGSVIDSTNNTGVPARIVAFRDIWLHPVLWAGSTSIRASKTYCTDTDSLGNYSFEDLPPGNYYILAIPLGDYAPSFYNTDSSSLWWRNATPVSVDGNSTAGIDIYVSPMISPSTGYTSIYGTISGRSEVDENNGIAGAIVYSFDANGNVAGYGISGSNGGYEIAELAPGTYSVSVDKPGYVSSSSSGSPDYDGSDNAQPANVPFTIGEVATSVSKAPAVTPSGYVLEQNYPNPFNPSTEIVFSIPQDERVNVSVYNILGQRVATLIDGALTTGTHEVTWFGRNDAGASVASGVYLYKISTSNFSAVKKMLLLK